MVAAMRTGFTVATIVAAGLGIAAEAARTTIPALEPTAFADTESVTNAPLRGMNEDTAIFRIDISLTASPSNNLELAFGKADDSGAVPFGEEALAVGWDCGRWFVASPTNRLEGATTQGTSGRSLAFFVRAGRDGHPQEWRIAAADAEFPDLPGTPPSWAFSRDWDHLRLTTRGVDACDPALSVRLSADGVIMFAR